MEAVLLQVAQVMGLEVEHDGGADLGALGGLDAVALPPSLVQRSAGSTAERW